MDNQSQTQPDSFADAPPWQGFHHVAVVTPDLDATIHFYRDVLGMHAGDIMARGERHCFIKPGDSETWGLHVFEYRAAELFAATPDMLYQRFGFLPGALQHIAFALPDEAAALALRERLMKHGVTMTGVNELGSIHNFLFLDNNGIMLEAAWPK